jgi:hypothetical protein
MSIDEAMYRASEEYVREHGPYLVVCTDETSAHEVAEKANMMWRRGWRTVGITHTDVGMLIMFEWRELRALEVAR